MTAAVKNIRWNDNAAIVEVAGDIDLNRSGDFQNELLTVLDRRPDRLIIDLSDVGYMDSSGVASLVKLLARAKKGGFTLALVGLQPRVRSVFEITRLDSVFNIYADEQEALEQ